MSIESRLIAIEEKVDILLKKSIPLENVSDKLTVHIDFVESIYETLKTPLNYITQSFSRFPAILPPSIT